VLNLNAKPVISGAPVFHENFTFYRYSARHSF